MHPAGITSNSEEIDVTTPRLRPFSEIARILQLLPIPRMHKNRRLSSLEKRRRQVVESYRTLMRQEGGQATSAIAVSKFLHFLAPLTAIDRDFLDGNASVFNLKKAGKTGGDLVETWEGCMAMAMSRRHWIEYYATLTKSEICLYHKHHTSRGIQRATRRPAHRIPMHTVLCVQPMRFQDIPLQGFSYLQIETYSRVYYMMVRSDIQLHEWIEAFVQCLSKHILHSPFDECYYPATYATAASLSASPPAEQELVQKMQAHQQHLARLASLLEGEAYLAKSACWKLDKKRLFNYRRIIFNPAAIPSKYAGMNPNEFIESILANVLFLSNSESNKSNALLWIKFMDEISWLQTINVSTLSENDRIAFFLNLYHVMVLHGSIVVGPPPAWNYWNAFFNNITYLFGYELISIADIEFNILK
jgi:hypothetical protein